VGPIVFRGVMVLGKWVLLFLRGVMVLGKWVLLFLRGVMVLGKWVLLFLKTALPFYSFGLHELIDPFLEL